MNEHPHATAIAAAVAARDTAQLAAAVTDTVRLRALLPGGPIEEHGRDAVVARFSAWFAPAWTPSTWRSRPASRWPTGC